MVRKQISVHLFIGEDCLSKDIKLKRLKQEFLRPQVEQFNLDILYAKELNLKDLQERLKSLPVRAEKRLIVIKGAGELKKEAKEFMLKCVLNPPAHIILILDISRKDPKDEFINRISKYASIYHFKETIRPDTFTLSRQIDRRQPDYALRILNQLLQNGEKPERILGGLRYSCERETTHPLKKRKRLKLLLNCDLDIKTGRLRPSFALEKLVINLCCLNEPFG